MDKPIKQIVILGGGSAGWLTAGLLAAEHKSLSPDGIQVTLVESPNVPTIGVGEGTWPSMRSSLSRIGLSETEFLRECQASFKQGSLFVGWRNGRSDDRYYHPFTLPSGQGEANLYAAWRQHFSGQSFADTVCEQGHLCDAGRAPKQLATPEFAAVVNYGYHLDAGKFGQMLQRHCTQNLGVKHVLDHVTQVINNEQGDIAALETQAQGQIAGDLFIDCSGTACLLLGEHLGIPFISKQHLSVNDRAIATQVPYLDENSPIASATIGTAQTAGWIWDIGLSSRRGVGHVYASSYISDDQAEQQLRDYAAQTIGADKAAQLNTRQLHIQAGHRAKFWHKNCVAVGMAAGFIEPLEASALAMVELSANFIRDEMPAVRSQMDIVAARFNKHFQHRWNSIIDFLKLHYVLSDRRDSDYWRDATSASAIPEQLSDLLSLWQSRPPYLRDFPYVEELFPAASYVYVLYGMGFETQMRAYERVNDYPEKALQRIHEMRGKLKKFMDGLPTNRTLLNQLQNYSFPPGKI